MTTTQTVKVREWLESGKTLTSNEAWSRWGITRLSAIIFRLRRQGYDISTSIVDTENRYGEPVRYGSYKLEKEA